MLTSIVWLTSLVFAQPNPPPPLADDWTHIVPGDARFYVELRDLASIRAMWQGIGIWQTVREFADRDTYPSSQPWQRRAQEILGLGPEEAISRLLGHRSALIASESSQWNGGVVIAELESEPALEPLLKDWQAKQLADEGPVKRYQLGGGILLAVSDRTLVLGPADDPDGLWGRTVLLLAGRRGPSLAARSDFSALRARLSTSPQGILFSSWARGDPTAFGGCTRLLAASQVTSSEINCELQGQRSGSPPEGVPISRSDLASLPDNTLAVWAGPVDFKDIARRSAEGRFGAPETAAGLILEIFTATRAGDRSFIDDLGPMCRVIVALDPAVAGTGFDVPALTVLIQTKKRGEIVAHLDGLLGLLIQILQPTTTAPDEMAPDSAIKKTKCEDVDLHSIEMGPALAARLNLDFLAKTEIAWAYAGDALLLSTSRRHAEQVIRAARDKAARLDALPDAAGILPPTEGHEELAECFFLRGTALSSMLSNWLSYLERRQPQALRAEWWRNWAGERVHQHDKLGIALRADPADPHRATVLEIEDDSPAKERLQIGDVISGVAGAPLASTQPAQEVAQRYQQRGDATEFILDVIREAKLLRVAIPVPPAPAMSVTGFDPVRAIRQIATLSRHADAVTVWRFGSHKDRFDARVRVRWQQPAR